MPEPIKDWSLTTLKDKLIKIGAKVVNHGRYVAFQMAEVAIPRILFADILRLVSGSVEEDGILTCHWHHARQYRGFAAARGTKRNDPLFRLDLQGQRVDDPPPMVETRSCSWRPPSALWNAKSRLCSSLFIAPDWPSAVARDLEPQRLADIGGAHRPSA
jgi:hypothetical protein